MTAVTVQEWDELAKKADDRGLRGLSDEERNKYLFNSFSRGHVSLKYVLELLNLNGCDECGKIVMPEEEHTEEDCTVWRVMES